MVNVMGVVMFDTFSWHSLGRFFGIEMTSNWSYFTLWALFYVIVYTQRTTKQCYFNHAAHAHIPRDWSWMLRRKLFFGTGVTFNHDKCNSVMKRSINNSTYLPTGLCHYSATCILCRSVRVNPVIRLYPRQHIWSNKRARVYIIYTLIWWWYTWRN